MRVVFRADSSLEMGTGHVMRCLALAETLSGKGVDSQFICRSHEGNLISFIRSKGFVAHSLPVLQTSRLDNDLTLVHSHWLGSTQEQDAEACADILSELRPDWLAVDHYALDSQWEYALSPYFCKLMAIDDLADRSHVCDLLLDQTFGRDVADYFAYTPENCTLLCGSKYALLREEFAYMRPYSLQRRVKPVLRELLITMGGVDKDNATGLVLRALRALRLHPECQITVVMGSTAPYLREVQKQAKEMPWPTQVVVGGGEMAKLMANSDLAIGAAGTTSWERCCLGLPSIGLAIAENQRLILTKLECAGATISLDVSAKNFEGALQMAINQLSKTRRLENMSAMAAAITDGLGANRVADLLYG
jgi:UDP-2,4-diacetamido-2,4,6-trideoxy-beta-L-altropyranose hydrolase